MSNSCILGFSGLHQASSFKQSEFPGLSPREYRITQGFDSAAALVCDGEVVAAAAEERFTREKATGAFPENAINYCLAAGCLRPGDIDIVAHSFRYEEFKNLLVSDDYGGRYYSQVLDPAVQRANFSRFFPSSGFASKLIPVEHHLAHAASAFYPSGFTDALILVSDGMGEIHSATVAVGGPGGIEVLARIPALHSLGILYGVFTLYLGYFLGVDEYKIMGLAPYGDPRRHYNQIMELVNLKDNGTYTIPVFALNQSQLEKETHRGVLAELEKRLGPLREPGSGLDQRHKDIAASLQAVLQTCQIHLLRHFKRQTGLRHLCLAGGVALNCSSNGIIRRSRLFETLFVQPAAGDDGTALGAALYVDRSATPRPTSKRMACPLWGPEFSREVIQGTLQSRSDCSYELIADQSALCRKAADAIVEGKIIGWFQGRMEYGPRALGSRSILADARDPELRDRINALVKKRESFRPFAPIVKSEKAAAFFDVGNGEEDTFAHMLLVTQVKPAHRSTLPAITHVDGSARIQTVAHSTYPRLWVLLDEFERAAGIPILLNTSFNVKGQPIVCTPDEAIDTFLFAGLDLLVLGDFVVTAKPGDEGVRARESAATRIKLGVG